MKIRSSTHLMPYIGQNLKGPRFLLRMFKTVVGDVVMDLRDGGVGEVASNRIEAPRSILPRHARMRIRRGDHEHEEIALALQHVDADATVLELGGCVGGVSCALNGILHNPERHVVMEIDAKVLPVLRRNRDRNKSRFSIVHGGLSRDPHIRFRRKRNAVLNSTKSTEGRKRTSPAYGFTDLYNTFASRFDTLVMDVEGAEIDIIRDFSDEIQQMRCIIVEFHPHLAHADEIDECRNELVRMGFQPVQKKGDTEAWKRRFSENGKMLS